MKWLRRILPALLVVSLLAAGIFLWLERDRVHDWWILRDYSPSAEIEQLSEDTAMTDYARRLFYVNKPTVDDKEAFNEHCAGVLADAAVLGCYRGDRQGIHIYRVTDERLHGIAQVTAAHEMLHQAYDRLSHAERQRVDDLLQQFHDDLDDQGVHDKLALYDDHGPNLVHEMHSIFGTEIADLPDELEEYYSRYFSDRRQVVAYHKQSRAAFNDYRQQIANYDLRLQQLQKDINDNEAALSNLLVELDQERTRLDNLLADDRINEYNNAVPGFNDQVSAYNRLLSHTRQLVTTYNNLVKERNDIAVQVTDLNAALDSSLRPQ